MRSSETEVTQLQDALSERSAEASELQERLDQVSDRRSDILLNFNIYLNIT